MLIVIDASVLVGLLVPDDVWHARAVALWETIKTAGHSAVYFDCVAAESISVIMRRLHEKGRTTDIEAVLERWQAQVPSTVITWILPEVPHVYHDVFSLIRGSLGALNFNDALIALACQRRGILAIASFDPDFDQVPWLRRLARPEHVSG
jgi:predicted nucleic acid-binding protein